MTEKEETKKAKNRIEVSLNGVGMPIFSCKHGKGYSAGRGVNICRKCAYKVLKKLDKFINK